MRIVIKMLNMCSLAFIFSILLFVFSLYLFSQIFNILMIYFIFNCLYLMICKDIANSFVMEKNTDKYLLQ